MTAYEIVGQVLSCIGMVIVTISFQINTKRGLLTVQSISTLLFCLSYAFLGEITGSVLNGICLVRNFFFYFQHDKSKVHYLTTGLLTAAMVAAGICFWQGPTDLLVIVALGANTVFLSFGKPQLLRWSILVTSPMMVVYNAIVHAIFSLVTEILVILSSVVGIARFFRRARE